MGVRTWKGWGPGGGEDLRGSGGLVGSGALGGGWGPGGVRAWGGEGLG